MMLPRHAIYELNAWRGYLLPALSADALRVKAIVGEGAADVAHRLGDRVEVFLFHVNLTHSSRTPHDRAALIRRLHQRGVVVINGEVTDISKRNVQRLCASAGLPSALALREGDPDELVIVKTDYNYRGINERSLTPAELSSLGYPELPPEIPAETPFAYHVTPRRLVPHRVWSSRHFFVERFIKNEGGHRHRVHVAGRAIIVSRRLDIPIDPIDKTEFATSELFEMPVSMGPASSEAQRVAVVAERFARAARLGFGALDVLSDNRGGLYVVDVNTTPYWGDNRREPLLAHLREGLARQESGPLKPSST